MDKLLNEKKKIMEKLLNEKKKIIKKLEKKKKEIKKLENQYDHPDFGEELDDIWNTMKIKEFELKNLQNKIKEIEDKRDSLSPRSNPNPKYIKELTNIVEFKDEDDEGETKKLTYEEWIKDMANSDDVLDGGKRRRRKSRKKSKKRRRKSRRKSKKRKSKKKRRRKRRGTKKKRRRRR